MYSFSYCFDWNGSRLHSIITLQFTLHINNIIRDHRIVSNQLSRDMTKPTKWVSAQRRLRSVFAVRMKKAWVLSYSLSAQRRLWSDWADALADLSLCWAHTHFVGFVMSRLIWKTYWYEVDKKAMIRNRYNRIPHPALKHQTRKWHIQLRRH